MEITSFAQLFAEAARLGVRLNSFHELSDGVFAANWRRGDQFFDAVRSDKPFLAARNSFMLAASVTEYPVEPKPEPNYDGHDLSVPNDMISGGLFD